MADGIAVQGLAELRRDLSKYDKAASKGLTKSLREAAKVVALDAQSRAPRGATGDLASKIKPSIRGNIAYVRDSALKVSKSYPQGFSYPRLIEYAHSGHRAFMKPAIQAKSHEVEQLIGDMLDKLASQYWHN